MATVADYKGYQITSPTPNGAGGVLLQNNTKKMADELEAIRATADALALIVDSKEAKTAVATLQAIINAQIAALAAETTARTAADNALGIRIDNLAATGGAVKSVNTKTGDVVIYGGDVPYSADLPDTSILDVLDSHADQLAQKVPYSVTDYIVSQINNETSDRIIADTSLQNEIDQKLARASNLADLSNITAAKVNLGLGNITNVDTTNASNINSGTLNSQRLPHYVFDQTEPAVLWSINHQMGKIPDVSIVNDSGKLCFADVNIIDMNNITITYARPFSGKAYLD